MKAKLKHASGQYVLIVDERPFEDEIGFDIIENRIIPLHETEGNWWDLWRIIAAENLEGVKGIRFEVNKAIIFYNDGNYKMLVKKLIDTELEVTEKEEYYIVRL